MFSFLIFAQSPRSEIITYISHNQIKDERLIVQDTVILQINERMGDNDAKIYIDYTKDDKLIIGEAWIEDMSGNIIRKLKNKEIQKQSYVPDMSLYEDDFIKYFELKHNVYPYRIVYSYQMIYSKFLNILNLNYAGSLMPVKNAKITLETTSEYPVRYKNKNIKAPIIVKNGSNVRYVWEYSYEPAKYKELKSSINTSFAPILQVVPINFKYGIKGSFDNWQTFGDWVYNLNKKRDVLPPSEQQKIDMLLNGVNDDKEKAKILYRYLQDYTRYINISINVGGFQTYPASYVCDNKYGDCKALSNYMQSMLKYAGIKSYYTLINGGDKVLDIDHEFPVQMFNHAILTVPLDQDTVFLECTSKNTPFGYISNFIQGRKAFIIDENKSRFINVPAKAPDNVLCSRKFSVNMETSEVNLIATERGDDYEQSVYMLSEINRDIAKKYIQKNILSGSYDLLDYKFNENEKDSTYTVLNANCKVYNIFKNYGNSLVISPFFINIYSFEAPEKRTTEVQLDYPEYYEDIVEYSLSGKNISKIPENIELESEFGKYYIRFEKTDNKLFVHKSFLLHSGRYILSQYKAFYIFIESVKNNENKNYYLEVL